MIARPPEETEAAAVANLTDAFVPDPISPELVRTIWTEPGFERKRDARVALESGSEVTGCAHAATLGDDDIRAPVFVVGEPAEELAGWAERRALELVRRRPARLFSSVWSENERGKRLLEARGYRVVRHFYRMGIDLTGPPAAVVWPEGLAVRTFRPGDERTFHELHQETFEDHWEHVDTPYDEWAHWMLAPERHDPELWYLVTEGDEPVGTAICHADEVFHDVGWVAILGVRRRWRRRGVGHALLLRAFVDFHERGFRRVVLGVDAESPTGAVGLYESAGMRVLHRFDSYVKTVGGAP